MLFLLDFLDFRLDCGGRATLGFLALDIQRLNPLLLESLRLFLLLALLHAPLAKTVDAVYGSESQGSNGIHHHKPGDARKQRHTGEKDRDQQEGRAGRAESLDKQ
mgnify:CR=1 FL=1